MSAGFSHETLVWFSKSFGLFYLIALSVVVVIYAYWPANRLTFDRAASSIFGDDDAPRS